MLQQDTAHQRAEGRAAGADRCPQPQRHIALTGLGKGAADPASVAGTIIAAPTASKAREAISVMAVGDSAAHSEVMPKMALPSSSRRLKPILSPRAPIGSTIPAITNE